MGHSSASRGVGVAFLVHKTFNVSQLKIPLFQNFESIIIQIAFTGSGHLNFATICRPLSASIQRFSREFGEFFDFLQSLPVATVISGDFNIHILAKN